MNDYYDPCNMLGYDPYQGMTNEERMRAGCLHCVAFVATFMVTLLLCALLGSCTTTKYVPVIETHTEHHWHTDSTATSDSVIHEKETVVMQADSAMMARFGIQLKENERAWLIRTKELEQQIRKMERMIAERDTVHDSIPYPVKVPEYVEKDLTWWQQTRLHIANVVLWTLLLCGILWLIKKRHQ